MATSSGQKRPAQARPITRQPTGGKARPKNERQAFEQLVKSDKVVVQQVIGMYEGCCGFDDENEFEIFNFYGYMILKAQEQSNCCSRHCCGRLHAFDMEVNDSHQRPQILIHRPFRCDDTMCCPCLNQRVYVEAPPGHYIGAVKQNWTLCKSSFDVEDKEGSTKYLIKGPPTCCNPCHFFNCRGHFCCRRCCCCCPRRRGRDIEYKIVGKGDGYGSEGRMAKRWSTHGDTGLAQSKRDQYFLDFPDEADPESKATMLAGCFLIDYLFYEDSKDEE